MTGKLLGPGGSFVEVGLSRLAIDCRAITNIHVKRRHSIQLKTSIFLS